MSILNQTHSDPVAPATRAATQIKRVTAQLTSQILTSWKRGFNLVWANPRATPAEVLAELGTDAAEAFELSAQTVAFMLAILPDRLDSELLEVQELLALRQPTTSHEDGTVTLD